jgi:endonuclease YncB( thermonuclease family)
MLHNFSMKSAGLRWPVLRWSLLALLGLAGVSAMVDPARAQSSAALRPSAADRERAQFPLCNGPRRFTCVVDGDTIWYRGAKIRIADIDTPEIARPRCVREAELGRRATGRLQSLLSEAPFRLEPAPDGRLQDRFGRELRVVKRGEVSIGTVLVREGLAKRWGSRGGGWC